MRYVLCKEGKYYLSGITCDGSEKTECTNKLLYFHDANTAKVFQEYLRNVHDELYWKVAQLNVESVR